MIVGLILLAAVAAAIVAVRRSDQREAARFEAVQRDFDRLDGGEWRYQREITRLSQAAMNNKR